MSSRSSFGGDNSVDGDITANHPFSILNGMMQKIESGAACVSTALEIQSFVAGCGVDAFKPDLWKSFTKDARQLIENQRLDFDALALCSKAQSVKAQSCHGPGIYAHVLYDRARNVIGIYVGSAYSISKRARDHINNYKAARVQQQPETRRRRKVKVQLNQHYRFWKSPGVEDFWLVINQFDPPRSFGKDETKTREAAVYFAYLLNFTELYAALLFRTLPPEILRAYLPKKSDVNPYQWVGLNSVNPITQFRSVLGEFVPVSKVQHPLSRMLGIGCRRPDKSKGDRTMVELVCPKCYNPNHVLLDKQPLYEIATGRYLKRQAQHYCLSCMEKRIFVPKDNSISSVCFAVVLQNVQKLEAKMNVPKVECRDDLVDLTKPQLKAWIYSRNFEPTGGLTKESLFTLAGTLLDQLLGWQLPEAEARLREFRARSNQPPRKLQTPPSTPEEVQIPPCTAVDKPARRDEENSETKTQEKPQDWMHINNRDQLKSLGPSPLGSWVQLEGFKANAPGRHRLQRALAIWEATREGGPPCPDKWKLPDPQCSFCFRSKLICDTGGTTRCSACVRNNVACYVRIPKPVPRPQPTPRPTPQPPPRSGASLNANVVCDTGGSMHHSPRVGNSKDSYSQGGSARPTAFVPNKRRYKPQGAPRPTKGVPTSQKCAPCFADRSACDGKSPCNRCIERGIPKRGIPLRCKPQGAPRYHKGVPIDQRCGPCFRSKRACDGKSPCGKCIESKSRCKPQGEPPSRYTMVYRMAGRRAGLV